MLESQFQSKIKTLKTNNLSETHKFQQKNNAEWPGIMEGDFSKLVNLI